MKYTVNKSTETIELLPSTFTSIELLELVNQFDGYSFLICSPQKNKKQGMVVGAAYVSVIGNIEHN